MPASRARAQWARFEHDGQWVDRLHVRACEPRSWCFVSHRRVVVQALSAGVSFRHGARSGALAAGGVLVLDAFDAHLRVAAAEGASFQVLLESIGAAPTYARPGPRPQHDAAGQLAPHASPAALFSAAVAAVAPLSTPGRLSQPVARARRFIEQNLASELALEALGRTVGVERCYLCRVFRRQVGLPPHRFRAHLRVARARELLAAGGECTQVAYAAGFCDQSHFNRCFKEVTGTTPGAFARACGAGAQWLSSTAA